MKEIKRRIRVFPALIAWGLTMGTVASACSQGESPTGTEDASSDATDGSPRDSSTDARDATTEVAVCKLVKPYASKDVDCNQCAEQHCCAEVNECLTTKNCDEEYVNCLFACQLAPEDAGGDAVANFQKCASKCRTDYPTGAGLFDALNACVNGSCKTECE